MTWTYEGYWNAVLGAHRTAADVVRDFEVSISEARGLDDWLGRAEAEAWSQGGCAAPVGAREMPVEWADHHARAIVELRATAAEDSW